MKKLTNHITLKKPVSKIVNAINRRDLSSNIQRVALTLLKADGSWLSRNQLDQICPSATARVRELRTVRYGEFVVESAPATTLNKRGTSKDYYYRIPPTTVSVEQVRTVFRDTDISRGSFVVA